MKAKIEIIESPYHQFILKFIENAPQMSSKAQDAVAQYIEYLNTPQLKITTNFEPIKPSNKAGK